MIPLEPYELMRMLHFMERIKFHRDTRLRSCNTCFNSPEIDEAIEEIFKMLNLLVRVGEKVAEARTEDPSYTKRIHDLCAAEATPFLCDDEDAPVLCDEEATA